MLLYQRDPKGPDDARDGTPDRRESPFTGSIHDALSACSGPVPEIVRIYPSGASDQSNVDVTTGNGITRYAVQQVLGKSLQDVSVEELARLGLKPGASQPEPPPTGNGDLVTPPLLEALKDYPDLTALVESRNGLRTNNGRDPIEDARQELGDLLQYLQQATMEGKDIGPLLKLCRNGLAVFEKPTPTLHPRPFFWDDVGLFGFVNHGRLPPAERHGLDWLLAAVPNALEAKEADGSVLGVIPGFGFRPHHTGPRTLREYLTSPTPDESPLNQK